MTKPRLLDLFCGAGGAAMGYARAGFDVYGVDIKPQPRYPFWFQCADAMEFPLDGFDVIHASPPCQGYSVSKNAHPECRREYPLLIESIRSRLIASGKPYVIENVPGAPLNAPILLCGTMFGLKAKDTDGQELHLRRHRLFESNIWLPMPSHCTCLDQKSRCAGVYGGGPSNRKKDWGLGGYTPIPRVKKELMGTPWMTEKETNEAIPPAYTEWVGHHLMAVLERAA